MQTFLLILKSIAKVLLSLFAPIIPIALGALLVSWALPHEYMMLVWTGVIMIVAGIIWGLILYLHHSGLFFN